MELIYALTSRIGITVFVSYAANSGTTNVLSAGAQVCHRLRGDGRIANFARRIILGWLNLSDAFQKIWNSAASIISHKFALNEAINSVFESMYKKSVQMIQQTSCSFARTERMQLSFLV